MVAVYKIDRAGGRARIYIPSLLENSKSFFKGVEQVTMDPGEDVEGTFVKIRPVKKVA